MVYAHALRTRPSFPLNSPTKPGDEVSRHADSRSIHNTSMVVITAYIRLFILKCAYARNLKKAATFRKNCYQSMTGLVKTTLTSNIIMGNVVSSIQLQEKYLVRSRSHDIDGVYRIASCTELRCNELCCLLCKNTSSKVTHNLYIPQNRLVL